MPKREIKAKKDRDFREELEKIRKSTKIISVKTLKIGTYMEKQKASKIFLNSGDSNFKVVC